MRAFQFGTISSTVYPNTTGFRFRMVIDNYMSNPTVTFLRYRHGDSASGIVAPWGNSFKNGGRRTFRLPNVSFAFGYRHRKIGGLFAYRISSRFYGFLGKGF